MVGLEGSGFQTSVDFSITVFWQNLKKVNYIAMNENKIDLVTNR